MRTLLIILLLSTPAVGQTISISGGWRSFIVSGQSAAKPVVVVPPVVVPDVPIYVPPTPRPVAQPVAQQERYLMSELWCPHCPTAKAAFLASGGKPENVITIARAKQLGMNVSSIPCEFTLNAKPRVNQPIVHQPIVPRPMPARYINWPGYGTIDLETYNRNCNCSMCRTIRSKQADYQRQMREYNQSQYTPESIKASQESTDETVVAELVEQMQLTTDDVVCDLGSGRDARMVVGLVKRYRCRGIGVEIDPVAAERSRECIRDAGLADRITIITGDALDFDFTKHNVTAAVAYLYPPLLAKLSSKMKACRIVATPYHAVPGLPMTQTNDVWMYRQAI